MVGTVKSTFGFGVRLQLPYEEAVERTKTALKEQGFGVLTEIDVRATLKQKLDVEHSPYVILGTCNPLLAHRALQADSSLGLLLPCNVIIYEDSVGTVVETIDPLLALGNADVPALVEVAAEARWRLQQVLVALAGSAEGAAR